MYALTNEKTYQHNHLHLISREPLPEDYIVVYLRSAQELARDIGSDVVIKPYSGDEGYGFRFSSDDYIQMARFRLAMFGDSPNPGQFVHKHDFFNADDGYKEQWLKTAQELLGQRNICFSYERLTSDVVQFRFDRPSHSALFFYAVDSGIIHNRVTKQGDQESQELKLDYFRPFFRTPGSARVLQLVKK